MFDIVLSALAAYYVVSVLWVTQDFYQNFSRYRAIYVAYGHTPVAIYVSLFIVWLFVSFISPYYFTLYLYTWCARGSECCVMCKTTDKMLYDLRLVSKKCSDRYADIPVCAECAGLSNEEESAIQAATVAAAKRENINNEDMV